MGWIYSNTRQQEADAEPNCVGGVFCIWSEKAQSRPRRNKILTSFFFFFKGADAQNLVESILLKGKCPGTAYCQSKHL